METTPVICDICGKTCKNERGLTIHIGHMHKGKGNRSTKGSFLHNLKDVDLVTKDDIIAEIHSLRQLIINLTHSLQQMNYGSPIKWEPLHESPSKRLSSSMGSPIVGPPLGMNYGGDHGALMNELRSALKERALASA